MQPSMRPWLCEPQNVSPGLRGRPVRSPRFARVQRLLRLCRRGKAPTSPISPHHVHAHKTPRPAAARGWLAGRHTSRGGATRTADQEATGAGATVPSRSSFAAPPTLLRSAGGLWRCLAQPALALPVVCPGATRPPPAQPHQVGADRRHSCTLVSCPRWRLCRIQLRRRRLLCRGRLVLARVMSKHTSRRGTQAVEVNRFGWVLEHFNATGICRTSRHCCKTRKTVHGF